MLSFIATTLREGLQACNVNEALSLVLCGNTKFVKIVTASKALAEIPLKLCMHSLQEDLLLTEMYAERLVVQLTTMLNLSQTVRPIRMNLVF